MTERGRLRDFIAESNRIEGIVRELTGHEVLAHQQMLSCGRLSVADVCSFVRDVTEAKLRDQAGMDVKIGSHLPPSGGPEIAELLDGLLWRVNEGTMTPHGAHLRYEQLHPFMDGNGRSGRAIWAWQMRRDGHDPFALPFLHRFYYQTLDASTGERT